MGVDISKAICEAIDIIVNQKLANADFMRTVQGKIVSTQRPNGSYKVTYSGGPGVILAQPLNDNIIYKLNQAVMLLLGNDNTVVILNKVNTGNNNVVFDSLKYNIVGELIVYNANNISICNLSSYINDSLMFINSGKSEPTTIDETIQRYMKLETTNGVVLSAYFTTRLAASQINGNYGLKFTFQFKKKDSNKLYEKTYTLDVRNITGANPYTLNNAIKVSRIIEDFPYEDFQYIKQIEGFTLNFPHDNNLNEVKDILIADPSISSAYILTELDKKDFHLFLQALKGTYLNSIIENYRYLPIKAILKKDGNNIVTNENEDVVTDVTYRWYVKDNSVDSTNQDSYGGPGWRLIFRLDDNTKRVTSRILKVTNQVYLAISEEDRKRSLIVSGKITTIKCIAFYNLIVKLNLIIINYNDGVTLNITNNKNNISNTFYNTDNVIFTCNAKDSNDNLIDDDNNKYVWEITASNWLTLRSTIEGSSNLTYNHIGEFSLGTITCTVYHSDNNNSNIYNTFYGTVSSPIQYKPALGIYYINIQGGNRLIQYNEDGTLAAGGEGLAFDPLTFELIAPLGAPVTKDSSADTSPKILSWLWEVPALNSLFVTNALPILNITSTGIDPSATSSASGNYNYYIGNVTTGALPFSFNNYNSKAINNTIRLYILYQEGDNQQLISETTMFTPIRMGDPGTNGTNTIAYLLPYNGNTSLGNTKRIYAYSYEQSSYVTLRGFYTDNNFNLITSDFNFRFMIQRNNVPSWAKSVDWLLPLKKQYLKENNNTFHNYTSYFNLLTLTAGTSKVQLTQTETDDDHWLANLELKIIKLNTDVSYPNHPRPTITRNKIYIGHGYYANLPYNITEMYNSTGNYVNNYTVNILRGIFSGNTGLTWYAEYPICYVRTINNSYRIKIKDGTGYTNMVYDEAGRFPRYDSTEPLFTIEVYQNGNLVEGGLNYTWRGFASPSDGRATGFTSVYANRSNLYNNVLGADTTTLTTTQTASFRPADIFDGTDLTKAITCEITDLSNNFIGIIHIPILALLNRYNHKYLNDWDGSSIKLDANGNSTILAPLIGAGKKNNDNTFTGVLMGLIKTNNNNSTKSETGIFGYDKGIRSFFLNSEYGSAEFGKEGSGQIKINVNSNNEAIILSGDYKLNATDGAGLKIKFSNTGSGTDKGPYIKYGKLEEYTINNSTVNHGKFEVDANGNLYASNAYVRGDVEASSFTADLNTAINGRISSQTAGFVVKNEENPTSGNSMIRGTTGIGYNNEFSQGDLWNQYQTYKIEYPDREGNTAKVPFRFWTTNGDNLQFGVTAQGTLFSRNAFIDGRIYSTSGQIGGWNLHSGYLSSSDNGGYFQINTSSTGGKKDYYLWAGPNSSDKKFAVKKNGLLLATAGNIGGWTIGPTYLDYKSNGRRVYFSSKSDATNALAIGTEDNYLFRVTPAGKLFATGANIAGTITANNGTIGGINLEKSEDTVYAGIGTRSFTSSNISKSFPGASISTNSITGILWGSDVSSSDSTYANKLRFLVSNKGLLWAKVGNIAGWKLNEGYLSSTNTGGYFEINTSSDSSKSKYGYYLWAGTSSTGTRKFSVKKDGTLYATGADITGKITATEGSFNGKITAAEGKIANWNIGTNTLLGGSTSGKHMYLNSKPSTSSNTANTGYYIWVGDGSTRKFAVGASGKLYSTNADISGSITATSLTLGDGVTVPMAKITGKLSADRLSAGSINGTSVQWQNLSVVTAVSFSEATSGAKIRIQNSSGTETWVSGLVLSKLSITTGSYKLLTGKV